MDKIEKYSCMHFSSKSAFELSMQINRILSVSRNLIPINISIYQNIEGEHEAILLYKLKNET